MCSEPKQKQSKVIEKLITSYLKLALLKCVYYFQLHFSLWWLTAPDLVSADQSYHQTVRFVPISLTVILPWAVSAAYSYCIALTKSSNSLSPFQNNPGLLTGCWHFWICTQDIRFVFTFPNYCTWTSAGDFQN